MFVGFSPALPSTRNAGKAVTMSGGLDVLQMKEEDVLKFLAAGTHLGGTNLDFQMEQYVYKRKSDGVYIINLKKTWEKLLLAARAIVAIENPADVCVISSRNTGQRAVLKFASATGATTFHGRFTPGTFTNQIQAAFREPRLLIVTDPRADHQPLTEASYVNIPTIALCNTDSPLRYVDIAIPCNNKGHHSVGLMWWMLAREVLRMRGTISREHPWEVMPDLYFYRDPEEIEKEEQAAAEKAVGKEEFQGEWSAPAAEFAQPEVADWSEGVAVPSVPIQQFPAAAAAVKTGEVYLRTGALSLPPRTGPLPLLPRPLTGVVPLLTGLKSPNGGGSAAAVGSGGCGGLFGNTKGGDAETGETKPTVRLNLPLTEPNERGSAEFNYGELVNSTLTQVKHAGSTVPKGLAPPLDPNDPFADDERERREVEELAKKFENKYKKKDRMQDLIDIGYGYDETDPFIDNSEAYDELVPASLTTKHGGFYINTGTLQFRPASDSEGENAGTEDNHFKKMKDGEERVIKKRRKKQDGVLEEKTEENKVPKPGEKEEMRKKNLTAAGLSRPNAKVPNANSTLLNAHPKAAGSNDCSIADLSADPAVMSLLALQSDAGRDGSFGMGHKAGGSRVSQGNLMTPPPLPTGLPGPLTKRIEDLRAASRLFDEEGRKKFFTLDMNNILLDIELQVQEQPTEVRSAVYSHLEAFVPCNKEALLKRLKKLSLNIQDDRLRTPLLKLKLAVCSVMPEQIARYNMDCIAKVAKQQSEEGEKNGSEDDDEEKPGKRVMGPRKKFVWDDKLSWCHRGSSFLVQVVMNDQN
ncbi:hypothetical protein INR49_028570 [Caranx melampygus]|nr:hypothetical protein INR49_028570 [Caranx melampygus]